MGIFFRQVETKCNGQSIISPISSALAIVADEGGVFWQALSVAPEGDSRFHPGITSRTSSAWPPGPLAERASFSPISGPAISRNSMMNGAGPKLTTAGIFSPMAILSAHFPIGMSP
jgi:hypothetical protein